MTLRPPVLVLAATLLVSLVGCSSDSPAASPSLPARDSTPPTTVVPAMPLPDPLCEAGPGREVEQLPDVVVPAVEVAAVEDPETGEQLAPGLVVPELVVDTGCVVRHTAPGGCLGAVDVSGATIPALSLPGFEVDGRVYPAVTVAAVSREAVHADEVCQVTVDRQVSGVTRDGVVREGFSRDGAARPGDELVPTVRIEPVRVPDVDVDPERLERHELEGRDDVGLFADGRRTSYVAPGAVLFDTDRATLRPEAVAALRAIAARIRRTDPARILVEGHADDRGPADHGQVLSERRADAVAAWLAGPGGLGAAALTARGYGETRPAFPNDSDDHRRRNRRVVITTVE
ncbi:OmpA family protein [Nocardioides sp. W7]|uniref:OmpA family protein n=1 Tax=Nocardioides sp. W7 TaxID=2931390 RepID=UPI001FD5CF7A|nr:OmpA family protein [Nocardioides sp. W7]